ncbi:BTB/POZ domain-containing protein At3g19850 isoform X2 [Phoenix dactylifera]|uniref:BTB/POZ domain-containing protein At3g19850 isoform X2 n=1 Tax=Phoenix dactylifera TaxID=42345 RepID=A0A8B7CPX0_PHODC|nr:BTB/POZ domain-containing protein At3g19850 isoform X2 [Phoenix dactylifera]
MKDLCDLKVHINGQHTFLLHQRILCSFSGRLKKMVKQERKRSQPKGSGLKITEFPGGPEGFELISRFCYSNGRIPMSPANVSLLHCGAIFLEMTEEFSTCNLLRQTETFLDGLFYWTWGDILTALKICETCLPIADSSGLLLKLIASLLAKISANSEVPLTVATQLPSSSSSCSSPDTSGFRCSSSTKTPETIKPLLLRIETIKPCFAKEWWFDDLTILGPNIIEKFMRNLEAYGTDNKNLILTRFLLHYLKAAAKKPSFDKLGYGGLADTAIYGVVLMGRSAFSCRGLLWVLRLVSGLGLSKECRCKLERLIGLMLDQATLDDLLVSGYDGVVYDVNLVLRLVRVFVSEREGGLSLQRMKKVGRLVDKYLGEISPDPSLKVSRFLGVAESLPDSARDCFDGVYRALDIYLESHPKLTSEECMRLCQCLNYEKLTLEACKDLAKNRRIPPGVAVQALAAQQSKLRIKSYIADGLDPAATPRLARCTAGAEAERISPELLDEKEKLKLNLQRMQNRVMELEKVCREMKGQMSKMD